MQRKLFAIVAVVAGIVSGSKALADDPKPPRNFTIEVSFDLFSKSLSVKLGVAKAEPTAQIDAVCPTIISAYVQQLMAHVNDAMATATRQQAEAAADAKSRIVETRLFDLINVRNDQVPFKQAIKNLAFVSGVPIAIDYKALRDAHIDVDAPVTLKVQITTVDTALRQVLGEVGLVYVIEDGSVVVTTADKGNRKLYQGQTFAAANDKLSQRLFDVGERSRRAGDYERAKVCYQQVHLLTPMTLHGRVAMVRLEQIDERMREASEELSIPGRTDDDEQSLRHMHKRTVPLGLVELSY